MARDFSTDGAFGAGGGSATPQPTAGQPSTNLDPGWTPMGSHDYGASGLDPGWTPGANTAINKLKGAGLPITPGMVNQSLSAMSFADGGAIPDDGDGDTDSSQQPDSSQQQPDNGDNPRQGPSSEDVAAAALATVDQALQYGRQKYGLTGGEQQNAGAIPIVPGTQSDSGSRSQPAPGPLPPTSNPFGRRQGQPFGRVAASQGDQQVAANMPAAPSSQSDSGVVQLPGPGTLAPTANPFGRRLVRPPQPSGPAIPDDQEG